MNEKKDKTYAGRRRMPNRLSFFTHFVSNIMGPKKKQRRNLYSDTDKNTAGSLKKRKKTNPYSIFAPTVVFIISTVISVSLFISVFSSPVMIKNEKKSSVTLLENPIFRDSPTDSDDSSENTAESQDITLDVTCRNAILYDITNDRIICRKASTDLAYPASLTKLMTAIIALESIENPSSTKITVDEETIETLNAVNASMVGFSAGEKVTATDLIYGCLLASGGDASVTLAKYIAGSEGQFVSLMNQKAEQIGCKNTHFVNCSGIHDVNHVSTAEDLCTILCYGLKNAAFRSIITTTKYYTTTTDMHEDGILISSTVYYAFVNANKNMVNYITGGKTGFTNEAGLCLAAFSVKGDYEYALIVLGSGDGTNTSSDHVNDTIKIIDEYT